MSLAPDADRGDFLLYGEVSWGRVFTFDIFISLDTS
jgi:hypothetical protein